MSLLREAGIYNKVPKEIWPELPPEGTIVRFKFNPVGKEINGTPRWNVDITLPTTSTIIYNGQTYRIGLVKSIDKNGEPIDFLKEKAHPQLLGGDYGVTIGQNANSNDLFKYLSVISENESSIYRLDSATPMFRTVNEHQEAVNRNEARKLKREAEDRAEALKDTELLQAALIFGFDNTLSPAMLRDLVSSYAEKNPKDFLTKINDDSSQYVAMYRKASSLGIVYVDGFNIRWKVGEQKILTMKSPESEPSEEFSRWVVLNDFSVAVVGRMKELIKEKEAEAAGKIDGRRKKVQ